MNDKTEGPAKDAGRTDTTGAKRPHATIDVKATDVTPRDTAKTATPPAQPSTEKPADAKPSVPQAGGAAEAAKTGATATTATTGKDAAATATSAAKPDSAKPEASKADPRKPESTAKIEPGKQASAAAGATSASAAPPAAKSAKGGFFSHLASGLVGGGLVYAATAYLPPETLPFSHNAEQTAKLEQRIKSLEAASTTDQVKAAEARLDKLESLSATVNALGDQSRKLEAETKAAAEKAAGNSASLEQVKKLQERLDIIARAAEQGDNRVPQLAAITGKIADLEVSVANQLGEIRKTVPVDLDARLGQATEAAEAAKTNMQRLERDLAEQRKDAAKLAQADEAQKANGERLAAAVQAAKEEAGKLSAAVNELKGMMAKPADVSAAISPVASKLASLEANVANVVKNEQDRKANAERIVLSLELANLKRAVDRGTGYAAELADVKKASGGHIDLAPLDRYKDTGVPTLVALEEEFRPLLHAVIDAESEPADGSLVDRFLAGARSVVRVRKVSHDTSDTSAEAVTGRIEEALQQGQLGTVLEQAKVLPARVQAPMQEWLQKVAARSSVDHAMTEVEKQLKASLSGAQEQAAPDTKPAPAGTN